MAEEAKDEAQTIPAAINRVVIAVFAIYALLPAVALSALPVTCVATATARRCSGVSEDKGGFAGDPVLGIVKHLHLGPLQHAGEIYVGLLAATILFIATNAGIIGVSRLVYSMGLHRQVPDGLRQLHPRFRTPWIGIIVFGGIACLTLIPGQATFLGNMYAFGAMLSFTIAHLAVIRLRLKRARPRAALPRARARCESPGASCRCSRSLGGLGTFLAFVTVTALHVDGGDRRRRLAGDRRAASTSLYRHRQGLDLDDHDEGRDPAARGRHRGRVRVGAGRVRRARLRARGDGDRGAAGGPQAPRDPRAGHDLGPGDQPDRRRAARAGGGRRSRSSRRRRSRSDAACPVTGRRCGPGRPAAGSSTRREAMRAERDRDADAADGQPASAGRSRRCCASVRAA